FRAPVPDADGTAGGEGETALERLFHAEGDLAIVIVRARRCKEESALGRGHLAHDDGASLPRHLLLPGTERRVEPQRLADLRDAVEVRGQNERFPSAVNGAQVLDLGLAEPGRDLKMLFQGQRSQPVIQLTPAAEQTQRDLAGPRVEPVSLA